MSTIYKGINGEFYAGNMNVEFYDDGTGTVTHTDDKLVKIKALSKLNVNHFECSNYHAL